MKKTNKIVVILLSMFSICAISFGTDILKTDDKATSVDMKHIEVKENRTGMAMVGFGTSPDNWVAVDFYENEQTLSYKDQSMLELLSYKYHASQEDVKTIYINSIVFKSYFEDMYEPEQYCVYLAEARANYIADYLVITLGLNVDVTISIEID